MDHLMSSIFMMELYYIVAILSAIVVPEASVASPSPSSGSSKDTLQLLSFKGMDHQEIVDLLICNSSPSKPNETSMKASPSIPKNIVSGFGKDSYRSVSGKGAPIEHGKLPLFKLDSRDLSGKGVNTKGSALVSGNGD
ncbi:hypothetical protein AMTR_s04541p00004770 [Amborella trichopoda]|uniref:BURP domain-containing protein n=1 Tax=Amborella trichopoda TaxID=13333 RepID=U5D278_AMBTC|nr:hypothetical protein AMTR_s04541p00004770 [Amborella trichopoda]